MTLSRSKHDVNSIEPVRRIWHSSIGFFICALYWTQAPIHLVNLAILPFTIIYGYFDYQRLKNPQSNDEFMNSFPLKYILRKEERNKMTSSFYFLIGVHITLAVFSRPVAGLSLIYLAWCDPAAAIVGRKFAPKDQKKGRFWNGKSYIGSLGAAVLGVVISLLFFACTTNFAGHFALVIGTSLLGGIYASLAELLNINDIDDNLTFPVLAGTLLTLFSPIGTLYSNQI